MASRERCTSQLSHVILGDARVFILYCKDSLLFEQHEVSEDDFTRYIRELADSLVHCGGIDCIVDIYENNHPINWNTWTTSKIAESDYVLLICSPQLIEHFTSGQRAHVLMHKGMYFSDTVVNMIEAPKFIPVFLNSCVPAQLMIRSWIPIQLHMSTQPFHLHHLSDFYDDITDISTGSVDPTAISCALQDPKHRELAKLLRHLRGENKLIPPQAPSRPIIATVPADISGKDTWDRYTTSSIDWELDQDSWHYSLSY